MKTTVSTKGQITIPGKLRKRLGIRAGTVLTVAEDEGRLILEKQVPVDPVTRVFGLLAHLSATTDETLSELRYGEEGPR